MLALKINPCVCTATTLPVRLPFEEKGSTDFVLGISTTAWTLALKSSVFAMLWEECMKFREIVFL